MSKKYRFIGINFDHMHMGDLLRQVSNHPQAEIAAICDEDPKRMEAAITNFALTPEQVFTDVEACLKTIKADVILLCPANAKHADYVERVAPYGAHILVEKPFAATLTDADRMIAAVAGTEQELLINWPLRWYPCHVTAKRLVDEGVIGTVQEIHYYDGNRGPLYHGADKIEKDPELAKDMWWYEKASGGGSLLDYLGYGVTLGTWFLNGQAPLEVTTVRHILPGREVDNHSITLAQYPNGLCKFETRWGTFTDPWTHQPQPKCGFVLKGTKGTIATYDYEQSIRVQTEARPEGYAQPVDELPREGQDPIGYLVHALDHGLPIEGPLSPAIARIGQQIVDTAMASAEAKRTLPLLP